LPRLEVVYADGQYRTARLQEEVFDYAPFRLHVVSRPADQEGWAKLPQRWVVERTFAWLGRCRRLSKDYEREPASSEAMVKVSLIQLMLRRLRPKPTKASQRFRYAA
jgi:putative transposase